jgi:hypothetical protein
MEHNKKAEEEWSGLLPKLQLLSLTDDNSPISNNSSGLHLQSDFNSDASSFLGQKGAGSGVPVAASSANNNPGVYTSFGRAQPNPSPPPAPSSLPPPPPPLPSRPPAAIPSDEYEDVYDETS